MVIFRLCSIDKARQCQRALLTKGQLRSIDEHKLELRGDRRLERVLRIHGALQMQRLKLRAPWVPHCGLSLQRHDLTNTCRLLGQSSCTVEKKSQQGQHTPLR